MHRCYVYAGHSGNIKIATGSVDGDVFYNFVCTSLLTKLMLFNGANQNSVVIQDNCSVHHVDEVHQALSDCGVITHYLPPYSPEYNPIELAFSKVKYTIKSMEAEMQAINDLETIVLAAFATITTADCQQWINSIGIYLVANNVEYSHHNNSIEEYIIEVSLIHQESFLSVL